MYLKTRVKSLYESLDAKYSTYILKVMGVSLIFAISIRTSKKWVPSSLITLSFLSLKTPTDATFSLCLSCAASGCRSTSGDGDGVDGADGADAARRLSVQRCRRCECAAELMGFGWKNEQKWGYILYLILFNYCIFIYWYILIYVWVLYTLDDYFSTCMCLFIFCKGLCTPKLLF